MDFDQIREQIQRFGVPAVAKAADIPPTTLYSFVNDVSRTIRPHTIEKLEAAFLYLDTMERTEQELKSRRSGKKLPFGLDGPGENIAFSEDTPSDLLEKIESLYNKDKFGPASALIKSREPATKEKWPGTEVVPIPIYDIRASAGAGALVEDGAPTDYQPFRLQQLNRLSSGRPSNLAVITVSGDSMWDTLHDGDSVLIDRSVSRVVRDGIYVLLLEGELLIKRCQRNLETGGIRIKSDNPAYDSFDVTGFNEIRVIGRTVWIGRNLG